LVNRLKHCLEQSLKILWLRCSVVISLDKINISRQLRVFVTRERHGKRFVNFIDVGTALSLQGLHAPPTRRSRPKVLQPAGVGAKPKDATEVWQSNDL
jgi:hypothetical protein